MDLSLCSLFSTPGLTGSHFSPGSPTTIPGRSDRKTIVFRMTGTAGTTGWIKPGFGVGVSATTAVWVLQVGETLELNWPLWLGAFVVDVSGAGGQLSWTELW